MRLRTSLVVEYDVDARDYSGRLPETVRSEEDAVINDYFARAHGSTTAGQVGPFDLRQQTVVDYEVKVEVVDGEG